MKDRHVVYQDTQYPLVLVTGATGWLGKRVVQALTIGGVETGLGERFYAQTIRCLVPDDEPATSLDDFGAEIIRGSITNSADLTNFFKNSEGSLLIHLAGVIHPPSFKTNTWKAINVDGTENLLALAKQHAIAKMTVMSSNSPLGTNTGSNQVFTEDSPYRPYMGYGKSKYQMEIMLSREMIAGSPLGITIVRSPWFYGPGQPPRQSRFFSMIREGRFPIFGSGTNRRSMGYVDNLAQGILLASYHPGANGEIFWIADEEPYSMAAIVETVAGLLENEFGLTVKSAAPRYPGIIADVSRLVDRISQGLGVYNQSIHILSEMNVSIACSVDKAKSTLGFEPRISLREGMRKSIQWCLESGIDI